MLRVPTLFKVSLLLVVARFAAASVVINEIHYEPPDKTRPEEFVELYNTGPGSADISGWYFSDGIVFVFPQGTVIPEQGYLLVAEDPAVLEARFGLEALGPYEGNLSNEGERVVLRNPSGAVEDEVDYQVEFPWPIASAGRGSSMELIHPGLDNDLGGSWRASTGGSSIPETPIVFIAETDTQWHFRKGTSEASDPVSAWRAVDFVEDGTWGVGRTSIGYGDNDDNTVLSDMTGNYSTVYLRHTFVVEDLAAVPPDLKLLLYVDDGCVVWINGVEVARFHVNSGEMAYNSLAQGHEMAWEEKLLTGAKSSLVQGVNVLAIHALNQTLTSSDFSIDAVLSTPERGDLPALPTPGARNSVYSENAAPQIRQVEHLPREPKTAEPIVIQAKITDPNGVASVSLRYQIVLPGAYIPALLPLPTSELLATPNKPRSSNPAFEDPANWLTLPMVDDGTGVDDVAGDAIYSGLIPAQVKNRTIVRYRIEAEDTLGATVLVPYGDDESRNFACFVYDGVPPYTAAQRTVHPEGLPHTYEADILTALPVYWLLTRADDLRICIAYDGANQIPKGNEDARDAFNWEGAFVYEGKVHDHIDYRLRQANDRYGGSGKRSMRFRFNKGRYLEARDNYGNKYPVPWRTMNTGKMFDNLRVGNFGLTETLNSILWNMVGVPAPVVHTFHLRVVDGPDEAPTGASGQYYGDFWGMFLAFEDFDTRFLETHGLPDGNLYKLKDGVFDGNKLKRNQGKRSVTTDEDFQNIRFNLRPERTDAWLDSHVRYDKWYPYHTVVEAIRHYDFVPADSHSKNRAWFFEPAEGTEFGLLWTLPHDSDASWGPNWNNGIDYSMNAIYSGAGKPAYKTPYRGVIREFRDLLWRPEIVNPMIDELALIVLDFSYADRDRWRSAPADAGSQDFGTIETKIQDMKNFAFVGWSGSTGPTVGPGGRAAYLDTLANGEGDASNIPAKPTVAAVTPGSFPADALAFESSDFSDPQGAGTFAAMKWRLGEVRDPAAPPPWPGEPKIFEWNAVWESEELDTFTKQMTIAPGAAVPGRTYRVRVRMKDTSGRWSHWSDPVEFKASQPSGAIPQLAYLRVTEILYNPQGDSGFEFIEVENIGPVAVDLSDVKFTAGIDFAFAGSSVTTLGPGGYAGVVGNLPVFGSRYDTSGIAVAGQYGGKLDNAGEEIALSYRNSPIQVFTFDDAWYPSTDGEGYSLVVMDPAQPLVDWSRSEGWRPSTAVHGSPGAPDETELGGRLLPGDVNQDLSFDISDPVGLLGHLFLGSPEKLPCGDGTLADPSNRSLYDMDGDTAVNLTDAIYALNYLFLGGTPHVLGEECVRLAGCPSTCGP